jgi:hypothetical protein
LGRSPLDTRRGNTWKDAGKTTDKMRESAARLAPKADAPGRCEQRIRQLHDEENFDGIGK